MFNLKLEDITTYKVDADNTLRIGLNSCEWHLTLKIIDEFINTNLLQCVVDNTDIIVSTGSKIIFIFGSDDLEKKYPCIECTTQEFVDHIYTQLLLT